MLLEYTIFKGTTYDYIKTNRIRNLDIKTNPIGIETSTLRENSSVKSDQRSKSTFHIAKRVQIKFHENLENPKK